MPLHKKTISILLISALLGSIFLSFLEIKKVQAAAVVYDPLYNLMEFVIKPLVRKIANSLENKLVNRTNKFISNISNRQPAFITNWRNHILESQGRGNDIFRAVLADTKLCPYFRNNLLKSFGADKSIGAIRGATVKDSKGNVVYKVKTSVPGLPGFQQIANCTLPPNFDLGTFRNDFTKGGGWETWSKLIEPQNNFFGAFTAALSEQGVQMATEIQSARDSSVAGGGFLSQKLGVGTSGLGPSGCTGEAVPRYRYETDPVTGEEKLVPTGASSVVSRCAFMGKEVTPAMILGQTAANTLDTKLKRVGGATYLTDVILSLFAAVVDGTTSRLANFAAQTTYDRPAPTPEPFQWTSGLSEQQFEPGAGDPNYDAQVNRIREAGITSCRNACLEREEKECPVVAGMGELVEVRDPVCMDQARTTCDSECSGI